MTNHHIKVLGDIEHVRTRPGMYVGSTEDITPLVNEVIDNAIDEIINLYGSKLVLYYNDEGSVFVGDNGRGIPVHPVKIDNKNVDSVIAIATKLFSSGKFDVNRCEVTIGQHGVGLTAVNALSKHLYIITRPRRSPYWYCYSFENGTFKRKESYNSKEKVLEFVSEKAQSLGLNIKDMSLVSDCSTIVIFQADPQYWDSVSWKVDDVVKRLKLASMTFQTVTKKKFEIFVNGTKLDVPTIEEWFREHFKLDQEKILSVSHRENDITYQAFFTYDLGERVKISPDYVGVVNYKLCDGLHVNLLQELIISQFPDKDIRDTGYSLNRLRAFVFLLVKDPVFDSQTKTRFVGRKQIEPLRKNDTLHGKVRLALKDPFVLHEVVPLLRSYMLSKITKSTEASSSSSAKNIRLSVGNPARLSKHKSILYVVEGQSAGGTLLQCRRDNESVFPLTGKVLNVETASIEKLGNNKEVKFLSELIKGAPWDKIVVLADADPDGAHISVLVSLMICKLFPQLIETGKFFVVVPPLYGVKTKNDVIFYNSLTEISDKANVVRYKGLGEMTPKELRKVLDTEDFWYQILKVPDDVIRVIVRQKQMLVQMD